MKRKSSIKEKEESRKVVGITKYCDIYRRTMELCEYNTRREICR